MLPRRVLVIHYHFLPVHNVAVKRLVGYIRHLPVHGWQPLVLTRDWRDIPAGQASWGLSWEPDIEEQLDVTIHRVAAPRPARLRMPERHEWWPRRRALKLLHMLAGNYYPDEFIGWAAGATDAAARLVRQLPLDAVITYCPPETNHVIGSRLARALGVPWIPFFGDLYGFFLSPLRRWSPGAVIRRRSHRHWMQPAAACIGVSPYMVEYLARTYRKRTELVTTGFEPADFETPPAARSAARPRLLISHVGSLYPGNQRPEIFLDGLDRFLRDRPDAVSKLAVRFVGSKCEPYLRRIVSGRPAGRVCSIEPKIDSRQALSVVRESDALLAFNCTAHRSGHGTMSYPTKVFEAFGAGRPILAMPRDDDWMDELLARTGGGRTAADAAEVSAVLGQWLQGWEAHGHVPYHGNPAEIAAFSTARQTAVLAGLLDQVSHAAA